MTQLTNEIGRAARRHSGENEDIVGGVGLRLKEERRSIDLWLCVSHDARNRRERSLHVIV